MAWGVWNKIKQGIKKAGNFVKKAVGFVADKVVKPFRPIIGAAATAFGGAKGGAVANKVMDTVERWSDTAARPQGWAADGGEGGGAVANWASAKGWS